MATDDADSWLPVLFDECETECSVEVTVADGLIIRVQCAGTSPTGQQSGTVLWPAAAALSRHLRGVLPHCGARCPERAVGVLELGAGTGLVGIAAAAIARASGMTARVLVTDHRCARAYLLNTRSRLIARAVPRSLPLQLRMLLRTASGPG